MAGYQQAYGGVPAAQVHGGVLTRHVVQGTEGARLVPGGAAWEGEPRVCTVPNLKTGEACKAPPIEGGDACVGHRRYLEKQQRRGE